MSQSLLVIRGLVHYWRSHVAVVAGVATAVAVLAGALLVGDSVRGSLSDLVLQRLGRTDLVVVSSGFFREALADDMRADETFTTAYADICPMIVVQGWVSDQAGGRRASQVLVYGVDDRFWRFHGVLASFREDPPESRGALLSGPLASKIGVTAGGAVLVRVERPSAVPIESLHGRKDDRGRTMRLTARAIIGPGQIGEFSLRPQQGRVLAAFVPLKRLQQELDLDGRVNTLLVSRKRGGEGVSSLEQLVRRLAALEDSGLTVRLAEGPGVSPALAVENPGGLLDAGRTAAAERAAAATSMTAHPLFTYLVNALRSRHREVPYSLVTATELPPMAHDYRVGNRPPIVVNEWTARDLGVHLGDPLTLEYYVWEEPGRLLTRNAGFQIAAVVPIAGAAADRGLAPHFPGISESDTLADWDPPFPIDLRRVRRADEDYWKRYRTTPKVHSSSSRGGTAVVGLALRRPDVHASHSGGRSIAGGGARPLHRQPPDNR